MSQLFLLIQYDVTECEEIKFTDFHNFFLLSNSLADILGSWLVSNKSVRESSFSSLKYKTPCNLDTEEVNFLKVSYGKFPIDTKD